VGRDGSGGGQAVGGVEEGHGEVETAEGSGGEMEAEGGVVKGDCGRGAGCAARSQRTATAAVGLRVTGAVVVER
jgi:hypothetical protein